MEKTHIRLAYESFFQDSGYPEAWFFGQRGTQIGRSRFWDDCNKGKLRRELKGNPEDGDLYDLGLCELSPLLTFEVDTWERYIEESKSFLVPIGIRTENSENLKYLTQVLLPERVQNYIQEGKAGVLFYCIGEWFVNQKHIDYIQRFIENNRIDPSRVGVLHDNVQNLDNKSLRSCQIPIWSIREQASGIALLPGNCDLLYQKVEQYLFENRNIKKEKTLTCLCRRFSETRAYLSGLLQTSKMMQQESFCSLTHLGLSGVETGRETHSKLKRWAGSYAYSSPYMRATLQYYRNLQNQRSDLPCLDLPELGDDLHDIISSTYNEVLYRNSFVSVVPETVDIGSTIFFSEKTFRPLFALQPFILVSTQGSLQKLKEMGYQTFDKWWDESYDEEENLQERLLKVSKIIHMLMTKNKETLFRMTQEMEPVLVHNARWFINSRNAEKVVSFLREVQG